MEVHKNLLSWTHIWKNKFAKSCAIRVYVRTWSTLNVLACQHGLRPKCLRANVPKAC